MNYLGDKNHSDVKNSVQRHLKAQTVLYNYTILLNWGMKEQVYNSIFQDCTPILHNPFGQVPPSQKVSTEPKGLPAIV